jgi:Ca2+/Na+ antiporter
MSILIPILLIIVTCLIIWRASDGFEMASEYLGRNLSEGVRGATINAIGSSMPELFTTIFFLFVLRDKDGFAGGIGTTAGSAVFNGVIIPSLVILVVVGFGIAKGVTVSKRVVARDGIALILAELLLILFIGGSSLDWWQGLILMLIYVVYIVYMLTSMRRQQKKDGGSEAEEEEEDEDDEEEGVNRGFVFNLLTLNLGPLFVPGKISPPSAWSLLIVATGVIGTACFLLVYSCEHLGEALGIPIYFVAVVLASAATSVPDTILSLRDARKGNYDDAVSNAIGSNIFDICFALGFPLFMYAIVTGEKITMSEATVADVAELRLLLVGLTVVAVALFYFGKSMGIAKAVALFALYVVFVVYILGDPEIFGFSEPISEQLNLLDHEFDKLRFWIPDSLKRGYIPQ